VRASFAANKCLQKRDFGLISGVDGATHSKDREIAYDRRREAQFQEQGFAIIRVPNADAYERINDVRDRIVLMLEGGS
jgi:very-short-patch-repair endonuclease